MRFNKLNRIRLRADAKKLQGGDNAEPVYFCSGVGASFFMEFSPGRQRSRSDPRTCLTWFGSMVPIFLIMQQVMLFEQKQRIEAVVRQESSIELARVNPGKTLRTFTGRQPLPVAILTRVSRCCGSTTASEFSPELATITSPRGN